MRADSGPSELPAHDRQVLRQFRVVLGAVKRHFHRLDHAGSLGSVRAWALGTVHSRPGIRVMDLARALDIRQPTASNVVRDLIRLRLIDRRKGEIDGRAVHLFLLPAGLAALGQARTIFTGELPGAIASMDPARLARLETSLEDLLRHMRCLSARHAE